jgi:hypothetical protein
MLKTRRQHQKTRKLLDVAAKQAKRQAKQALAGPAVKKEKVKKKKVKKEKVETEKVKKVKLTKEELGRQDAKTKKSSAGAGKKGVLAFLDRNGAAYHQILTGRHELLSRVEGVALGVGEDEALANVDVPRGVGIRE